MIEEYIGKLVAVELKDKTKIVGNLKEAKFINEIYTILLLKGEEIITIEQNSIKNIYRIKEIKEENKEKKTIPLIKKRINENLIINKEELLEQLEKYGPSLNQFCSIVAQNIYYFQKINISTKNICIIIRDSFCSADILFELIRLLDSNYNVFCDVMKPTLKYLEKLYFINNLNIKKPEKNFIYDLLLVASDIQIDIKYKSKNYIFLYNPQEINSSLSIDGKKYTLIYGPKPNKSLLKKYKEMYFVYIYGGLSKITYNSFNITIPDGNFFQLI